VRWSTAELERTVELVDRASPDDRRPAVEALVQAVVLTNDAARSMPR